METNTIVKGDKRMALVIDPSGQIITSWSIRGWRLKGGCPHFIIGRNVFYRMESVFEWMKQREKGEPEAEPQYGTIRKIK